MMESVLARVYARAYPGIARRFPPYRKLRDEILAIVARHPPAAPDARVRVLDLALGPGELALALAAAGHEVVGIESSGAIRRVAKHRTAASANIVIASDLREVAPFDVVLSLHALYADPVWKDRLRIALQALRPGGIAVLVNFAAPFPMWQTVRTVARRNGLRAAIASLVWLIPNALFDRLRRPRTTPYWPQAVFEERVAGIGFEIVEVRRTFLNDASVLIVARRPAAVPPAARARERRVARIVLYEIAESIRFAPLHDDEQAWVRTADATLFGKDVVPFEPHPAFARGVLILGRARSSVVLPGSQGPVRCTFDVLTDSAPDRPGLDKLLVTASGILDGRIDLREAPAGWATAGGTWTLSPRSGRFVATFFIPMTRPGDGGPWYVGHDDDGRPLTDSTARRPLRRDELVLGLPATKVVLSVFESGDGAR